MESKKDAEEKLRYLQRRLVANQTSTYSYYTRIPEKSQTPRNMDFFEVIEKAQVDLGSLFSCEKVQISLGDILEDNEECGKARKLEDTKVRAITPCNVQIIEYDKPTAKNPKKKKIPLLEKIRIVRDRNEEFKHERGVDCLYVGYPYITGLARKGEKLTTESVTNLYRAPLLLWKAKISDINSYTVEISLENPIINNTLLTHVAVANKTTKDISDNRAVEFGKERWIENVIQIYEKAGFNFNYEATREITTILRSLEVTKFENAACPKTELVYKTERLNEKIEAFCCLGIFPQENDSLIELYTDMLENGEGIEFCQELDNRSPSPFEDGNKTFQEKEIKQITPLDYTQKLAIKTALGESVVIQGPPGTGKSQVIANIVANAIFNNKTVLMVSEKSAATEVLEKRLSYLKNFALSVFSVHSQNEKEIFLNKVKELKRLLNLGQESFEYDKSLDNIVDGKFTELGEYSDFKTKNETKEYVEFLKKYGGKISTYRIWEQDLSLNTNFSSNEEFWKNIDECLKMDENVKYFSTVMDKFSLILPELEKIHQVVNSFEIPEINREKEKVLFFLRKQVKPNKVGFFGVAKNKKFYKKNPFVCDFLFSNESEIKNKFKSFNFNEFRIFREKVKNPEIIQLINFVSKYNRENFNYDEFLNSLKILNFEKQNANQIKFGVEQKFSTTVQDIKNLLNQKTDNDVSSILNLKKELIRSMCEKDDEIMSKISRLMTYDKGTKIDFYKILKDHRTAINALFPIAISNPDTAALLFKNRKFDYVIIDEASQLTLERAMPLLYLAKTMVISGDKQQMPPYNYFKAGLKEEMDDDEEEDEEINHDVQESESLLEYIEKKIPNVMLKYHYRSSKTELIQFSNVAFYNGELIIANSPKDKEIGIELVEVKEGKWDNQTNREEAKAVVEKIKEIVNAPNHGSIGVITFNVKQKGLIEDMLIELDDLQVKKERSRKKPNGEDESLFIKNLDNVQGDERDIIIFSISYGKTANGKFSNQFGNLNKDGGEKRMNVAISRAKEKIYVFKSIPSGQINRDLGDGKKGVRIFHDYLEYVEQLEKTKDINSPEIKEIFDRYLKNPNDWKNDPRYDSPFEKEVYDMLNEKIDQETYELYTQVPQGSYRIDLTVKNKKTGNYILAIECDGFLYHKINMDQKERDFYRQNYLEERGWKFYRIDSLDWFNRKVDKKNDIINEILNEISGK